MNTQFEKFPPTRLRRIMVQSHPSMASIKLWIKKGNLKPDAVFDFKGLLEIHYPEMLRTVNLNQKERDILKKYQISTRLMGRLINNTSNTTDFMIKKFLLMLSDHTGLEFTYQVVVRKPTPDTEEE